MKKIIFSTVSLIVIFLSIVLLKFMGGWSALYLFILPLLLRIILIKIYKLIFVTGINTKIINLLTFLAYLIIIGIIVYAIKTADFGNSWI